MHSLSLAAVVATDLLTVDPRWLPHPVRWIGGMTTFCDECFYPEKRLVGKELLAGAGLCLLVIGATVAAQGLDEFSRVIFGNVWKTVAL